MTMDLQPEQRSTMSPAGDTNMVEIQDPKNMTLQVDELDSMLANLNPVLPAIEADDCRVVALVKAVRSGEIRDATFTATTFGLIYEMMIFAWKNPTNDMRMKILYTFCKLIAIPEFDVTADGVTPTQKFIECLFEQAGGMCMLETEHVYLKQIIFWCYNKFPSLRPVLRRAIGQTLKTFLLIATRTVAVVAILEVLCLIMQGFRLPLAHHHMQLLKGVLLPLHTVNRRIGGRGGAVALDLSAGPPTSPMGRQTIDGQPILSLYHVALVQCELQMIKFDQSLALECAKYILEHWPEQRAGVSAKEVLLLHELEKLMESFTKDDFDELLSLLLPRLITSISGDFAMIAQRALQFWKNEHFVTLSGSFTKRVQPSMIVACYRGHKPHWNATVNRLSAAVLEKLHEQDPEEFKRIADSAIPRFHKNNKIDSNKKPRKIESQNLVVGTDSMKTTKHELSSQSVTQAVKMTPNWSGGKDQPPATITGVAPWALQQEPMNEGGVTKVDSSSEMSIPEEEEQDDIVGDAVSDNASKSSPSSAKEDMDLEPVEDEKPAVTGFELVMEFVKKHLAESKRHTTEMNSMAETPTLLPTLKFHNLVWGHDLGNGAFSQVKYAKHVTRGMSNSEWPQYAVKIVSISKIQEEGYEASLAREISILRVMSHPGIARLVTGFRWRDGVYMVLEYAAKGDLHSYITQQGSMDVESTRFIVGEVLAALSSIHSKGFVFADLKPENVVLTASGHAKITDFGAARPLSAEAMEVTTRGKRAIRELRDGDHKWRQNQGKYVDMEKPVEDKELPAQNPEDMRIEGTAAYLAPEVARGGRPCVSSDIWAFGCLLYQCLEGRPPIWAETVQEIMAAIVRFTAEDQMFHESLPTSAKSLITSLLEPSIDARIALDLAAAHEFFSGVDVFSLYKQQAPELQVGAIGPKPDAKWARRQNSMLWNPMPQEFTAGLSARAGAGNNIKFHSIDELEYERKAPFLNQTMRILE